MEQKGTKEIVELLEGVKILAITAKKALADGKISLADLPLVLEAITKVSVLVEAVNGVDQVPSEVKDLTAEEIQMLVSKVLVLAAEVKAA